jgi:hypothetical protein
VTINRKSNCQLAVGQSSYVVHLLVHGSISGCFDKTNSVQHAFVPQVPSMLFWQIVVWRFGVWRKVIAPFADAAVATRDKTFKLVQFFTVA